MGAPTSVVLTLRPLRLQDLRRLWPIWRRQPALLIAAGLAFVLFTLFALNVANLSWFWSIAAGVSFAGVLAGKALVSSLKLRTLGTLRLTQETVWLERTGGAVDLGWSAIPRASRDRDGNTLVIFFSAGHAVRRLPSVLTVTREELAPLQFEALEHLLSAHGRLR